ncbi:hypothetical protein EJ08DRAFT_698668 [Tothia fuscella]|uniref:Uncharacterized protein n=1 Tax=Tothia fuscella TaxID=1048955 RepID=A0A9P4NP47_9PEZI|nr:hypothetical protein EJ08DRAFT_698668 [Tothia fuscella]
MTMVPSIQDLPNELLDTIFAYVSLEHRYKLRVFLNCDATQKSAREALFGAIGIAAHGDRSCNTFTSIDALATQLDLSPQFGRLTRQLSLRLINAPMLKSSPATTGPAGEKAYPGLRLSSLDWDLDVSDLLAAVPKLSELNLQLVPAMPITMGLVHELRELHTLHLSAMTLRHIRNLPFGMAPYAVYSNLRALELDNVVVAQAWQPDGTTLLDRFPLVTSLTINRHDERNLTTNWGLLETIKCFRNLRKLHVNVNFEIFNWSGLMLDRVMSAISAKSSLQDIAISHRLLSTGRPHPRSLQEIELSLWEFPHLEKLSCDAARVNFNPQNLNAPLPRQPCRIREIEFWARRSWDLVPIWWSLNRILQQANYDGFWPHLSKISIRAAEKPLFGERSREMTSANWASVYPQVARGSVRHPEIQIDWEDYKRVVRPWMISILDKNALWGANTSLITLEEVLGHLPEGGVKSTSGLLKCLPGPVFPEHYDQFKKEIKNLIRENSDQLRGLLRLRGPWLEHNLEGECYEW